VKIYIQSKSGNYNHVVDLGEHFAKDLQQTKLHAAFVYLRGAGGYQGRYRTNDIWVPFEEIEFIREAVDTDED
jgi:hypothetical protein